MMITMILRQSGGDQISKPLFFSKFVLLPNVFTLSQCSKCGDVPCGQPCVSGNPSAIMLFYQAVRGGCLETGALSCRDNISFCGHTPTSQPRRHHSRKKSKNMFYWNLRIGDNTTIKLNKLYFKLSKTLLIILHNLQYIARYFDKDFSNFVIFSRKCHFLHL